MVAATGNATSASSKKNDNTGRAPAASAAAAKSSAASSAGGKGGTASGGGAKSGPGGAGGVRSSGGSTRASATSSAAAAAGAKSAAAAKSSAASSAGSKGGYSGPKGTPAGGLNSAARNAATGGKGYSGPKGTPSGGLNAAARGGTIVSNPSVVSGDLGARARAVSRGPGLLGSLNTNTPSAQNRALTSIGLSLGERYGLPGNTGITAAREMAKTLAGEVGKYGQSDYDAAARTMTNRLDAMRGGYTGFGDDVKDMLGAYDANRYTARTQIPATLGAYSAYKASKPGTASFQKGISGIANAMSPYSAVENSPVARATHYYSGPPTKGYQSGFTAFGPHNFGSPEISANRMAGLTQAALSSPGGLTQMAGQPSPTRGTGPDLDARIAAMQAASPTAGLRAAAIPSPNVNNDMTAFGRSFPARPEVAGAFPAATPGYSNPGRSFAGIPDNGLPGYSNPSRSFAGIPDNGLPGYSNPGRSFAGIPDNGLPGYSNPGRSFANVPTPFRAAGAPEPVQSAQLRNPIGGMSFNPGLPGYSNPPRSFANVPDNGLPGYKNPGRSFAGIPDNGLPGYSNPGRSFAGIPSNGLPGYSNPARSFAGIPDNGLPGYSNPGRSFAGIPSSGFPRDALADASPEDDPMDPIDLSPPTLGPVQDYPRPYMQAARESRNKGMPDAYPRGVAPDTLPSRIAKEAIKTGIGSIIGVPGAVTAFTKGTDQLSKLANEGRLGNRPGQAYALGSTHADAKAAGGKGGTILGDGPGGQWTGKESPGRVANMQQHVEEVLRGYFVEVPGQQYPQYTTSTTPIGVPA